jgi:hypothetical protein
MNEHIQQTVVGDSIDVGTTAPITAFSRGPRGDVRTLPVVAIYHLSEEGRKASLLAGGDGRALQEVKVQVPTNRFHLVNVDADGQARLKLRPQYNVNQNQEIVRNDASPVFDHVPSVDDLLKHAARNHQLEGAFRAEQAERQRKRKETGFEAHQKLAEHFLADPALRAMEHPRPTTRKCFLATKSGRKVLFDAKRDMGIARQVPAEASRRFDRDYEVRREKNSEKRSRELALHVERDGFVAEWIAQHATPEQRDRHARGLLPVKEVVDVVADATFAVAKDKPQYVRNGVDQFQEYIRQFPQYASAVVTKDSLIIDSANAESASESQWALIRELQVLLPDARVTLRRQRLSWALDLNAPALTVFFVLVTQQVGPFLTRREFLAPSS